MAITTHGDQFIIDGLEAIRHPLKLYYSWQMKIATWRFKLTGKKARIEQVKPLRLDGVRNVAIFVLVEDRPDVVDYLADLKSAGYYVITVVNRLDIEVSEALLAQSDALMKRENLGRDFGAYADVANKLRKIGADQLDRVLFANDSMYYLRRSPEMFTRMIGEQEDYVAMSATEARGMFFCHAYLFQMSGKLFRDKRIRRYFARYIPVSSARYAVFRGEMGLSRLITNRLGRAPVLYFQMPGLSVSRPDVAEALERQMEWLGQPNTENAMILSERRAKINEFDAGPLLWSIRDRNMVRESHTVEHLARVHDLDPSQQLGLLFLRFTDFPFLKRNMFAKGFASYQALREALADHPYGAEVLNANLRTYGSFYANPSWKRILKFATLWGYR